MNIEHLNSQASLEQLASYILKAANQADIIDDTTTVTDSAWSSNKVQTEIDNVMTEVDESYVAISQGTSQTGKYMLVDSDGNVVASAITFETDNIDFENDF